MKNKSVHLALQGGGAHGAFTWGVLDKLLEDGRLSIDSIAATSAGSMNAITVVQGFCEGGYDGARQALHTLWERISSPSESFPVLHSLWHHYETVWKQMGFTFFEEMTHIFSPYQYNPLNLNALKDILDKTIDFERIKKHASIKLFISATKVRTGAPRIFSNDEISMEVILASACLPYLFQSVKVGDDYYWDGGYMGNPPIFPLFYQDTPTRDVIIVHINPIIRDHIPITAHTIFNRINEITFNSSLLKEFRAIAFVNKLIEEEWLKDEYKDRLKHMLIHSIRADKVLLDFDVATKFNRDWNFLTHLRDLGRTQMSLWLQEHYNSVGKKSTVELKKDFLSFN